VKELVDKGEIVAEMKEDVSDVAYHKQGNIDLYSEENLKRRIKLQEDDYIVALTQRLWLASPHDKEGKLNFNEYEQFMLRLHRLILPEFKMEDSKDLIKVAFKFFSVS
jgi:hypothetical protein